MTDLHTLIDRLGDRCPEDLRFYVETGHKAAFVVDVRRYAGRALAALCRVVREQDEEIEAYKTGFDGEALEQRMRAEKAEADLAQCRRSYNELADADNATISALHQAEAERDAIKAKRLPCSEAEVAQRRYEQAEAERDEARRQALKADTAFGILSDLHPEDAAEAWRKAGELGGEGERAS